MERILEQYNPLCLSCECGDFSDAATRILENSRRETGERNRPVAPENSENCGSETTRPLVKSRECRTYFCRPDIARRDRTGWLGWEDSNSEMSSQNIPLKGRTDFRGSYIRCSNFVRIAAISSLNFRRHFLSRARTSSVVGSSPDSMQSIFRLASSLRLAI